MNWRKRLLRYSVVTLCACLAFAANHAYVILYGISRDYDFDYIAENCQRAKERQVGNLADYIAYDRSGWGHVYILERNPIKDLIPNEIPKGGYEVARRGPLSEFLCFPFVRCLSPPHLSKICEK